MLAPVAEPARLDRGLLVLPPDLVARVRAHMRDVPAGADQN